MAEEQSFTRAAARCHVVRPAISQQIQALEKELGEPLFERLPRQVVLISGGAALLPHARACPAAGRGGGPGVRRPFRSAGRLVRAGDRRRPGRHPHPRAAGGVSPPIPPGRGESHRGIEPLSAGEGPRRGDRRGWRSALLHDDDGHAVERVAPPIDDPAGPSALCRPIPVARRVVGDGGGFLPAGRWGGVVIRPRCAGVRVLPNGVVEGEVCA
ncbi:LysR family transcriptional regulator [Streptomyces sp. NPDC060054]|uniref:LysR family transcriptional regulator n=1 Tax=unclassified Streptomyces TaxID=2593676 RepID=UPI0036C25EEE